MDIYVLLWLLFFIAPISTVLHECGHMLGARLVKADQITLAVGVGKKMYHFSHKQYRVSIHALFFLGGLAYSERNKPYKPMEIVWITICGPFINGIAACLVYLLFGFANGYVQLFILFNIWLAIVNIIPFKLKEKHSDGYTIVKTVSQAYTHFKEWNR
ncbi:site-2 protease family protein [Lentibacillus sp. Marseille-P4043]|uniref:site-2 protease family protein n=1 Tax=Lentibacillus sp. Marseille-P4043 TaxID=2040293 RepID=UPI000D0B736F|nr:site-2 protease family protein [Lentibacillus sp. Marseille-P4043]